MCSGGIHDSGSRPIINNSRRCRASARSLFARFLFPRLAAVSAGSARCTFAPTRSSSSATNRQPVVASNPTSSSRPRNCSQNSRTPVRCAGLTRRRDTSPVSVSNHSAVICALCWSNPITIVISTASSLPQTARPATTHGPEEGYRRTRTARHMPSIKSRRRSSAAAGDTAKAGQTKRPTGEK
jgi:hypothetical protein